MSQNKWKPSLMKFNKTFFKFGFNEKFDQSNTELLFNKIKKNLKVLRSLKT